MFSLQDIAVQLRHFLRESLDFIIYITMKSLYTKFPLVMNKRFCPKMKRIRGFLGNLNDSLRPMSRY